jgi:hypothetical protein
MSRTRTHIRHLRPALAAAALLAGTAPAQTPALDEARAARAVADQKLADDVERAVADARNLAVVSKLKAAERLRQTQLALDTNATAGADTRRQLSAKIQAALAAVEGRPAPRAAADPNAAAVRAADAEIKRKAADEAAAVADGIARASRYADAGDFAAARRQAEQLAARYPNNPQVAGLAGQRLTADLLRQRRNDAREYELAWLDTMRATERTAVPMAGEIQFPDKAKWQDLTKRRREADRIKLTPKEEAILKSLDSVVIAPFNDRPFEEALQELSNLIDQPIYIDKKSLEDAGIDLTRRTSFKGRVSARMALRALLQGNGLTFVVKDEMIQVVTVEKAEREMLVTRSYYLGDLVQGNGPFGNGAVWGPYISYQQTLENANLLVKSITDQIDPQCWKQNGGACTISFHLPTMSVVVRGSTEVHAALGGAIGGGK